MSPIVYRLSALLVTILKGVPLGTNLGLYHLLFTLLTGRLLSSRGALFPALTAFGLEPEAVRRAEAALCYGRFQIQDLVDNCNQAVLAEGHFYPHAYGGVRPVPVDLTGFFRPQLQAWVGKHYHSQADKALSAISVGIIGAVGTLGTQRLALPRALLLPEPGDNNSEQALKKRTLAHAKHLLEAGEVGRFDSGFEIEALLESQVDEFIVRAASNFTARRNFLPAYKGVGCRPKYAEIVRPLARTYRDNEIAATPCDATVRWKVGKRWIKAYVWDELVPEGHKPGGRSLRCVVVVDPKYKRPLVLVTTLRVSGYHLWCLYFDRWPIEPVPLSAKPMLGAQRAFVFGQDSRVRLPALAVLAGSVLSYVAATRPVLATGFWDRCARPTCGRLRRVLSDLHFRDLPAPEGPVRKKASVTEHLPKGVTAHRRSKGEVARPKPLQKAA
jgi:hypothetical protein